MSDQYTPSMDEVLDAWVDVRCANDSRAHLVERAIQDAQRALAAFKRDTEIALLERLADSGQAKMFSPAVYVGPERMKLSIRVPEWLRAKANELRKEQTDGTN